MIKEGCVDAHVKPDLFPVRNIRFNFDHIKWDAQSAERPHRKDGEGSERREKVLLGQKNNQKNLVAGRVGFIFKKRVIYLVDRYTFAVFCFPFSWSQTLTCARVQEISS